MCSIVWERWGKILILYTGLNDTGVWKYGHRRHALLVSWHAFLFLLDDAIHAIHEMQFITHPFHVPVLTAMRKNADFPA